MNPDKPDYEILFDQIAKEAMVIVKSASRTDNPHDRACAMKGSFARLTELIGKI